MYYIKPSLILIACFFGLKLYSQNNFDGLGETGLSVNHEVNNDYDINFSIKSRYYFYQNDSYSFEIRQLDFVHFSTLNLSYNTSLSLGIQYRVRKSFDGGGNELRLTQQFNHTKKHQVLRFGHRVRIEQRILNELTILRTRYRFAIDLPLNGEKLDIGESYLVTSMEALLSNCSAIKPEVDHRTTVNLGWLISQKSKVQLGLEYRFEALNLRTAHKLFINTSYILKM